MTDDLAAFLRDRLFEDEAFARPAFEGSLVAGSDDPGYVRPYLMRFTPARVLREVAAKRAILAAHEVNSEPEIKVIDHIDRRWNTGWVERQETGRTAYWCQTCDHDRDYEHISSPQEGCDTLRHLAAVYSDHPDYRQEWAP